MGSGAVDLNAAMLHKITIILILAFSLLVGSTGCAGVEVKGLDPPKTAASGLEAGENLQETATKTIEPISSGSLPETAVHEAKETALIETAAPTDLAAPKEIKAPTETMMPTSEVVQILRPEGKRTKYRLEATLDYGGHTLEVKEGIDYINTSQERISFVEMVIEAQRYPGTFRLKAIYDGKGERIFQYQLKETTLTVRLPMEIAPGEITQLSLEYSLHLLDVSKLPQVRPYPLGFTTLQTNFGDWYPFIPPYKDGAGWLVHPPAFYGEHLVYDLADFEVAIRVEGGGEGLVIAAGAPEREDGEWRRYELEAGRSFAWSVSPYYQVVTETVELMQGVNTTVSSYYFPPHAEAGESLLEAMVQALEVYSRRFGAYPQPVLAGVQADFLDGMEYDGLFFLSTNFYNWHQSGQADFLAALAAHETAHQWWYRLVGNDQALEPWLDEALCTYSELIYYENLYPEALDWWWTYRVNYYEPEGWVDMQIYDAPQTVGQYRAYRDPVYLRGALFLEELREVMGDEAFFAALKDYVRRYAFRMGEGSGFWEVMADHTPNDLEAVRAKYFKNSD